MEVRLVVKIILCIWCVCLIVGGATHIFDSVYFGLLPYKFVPLWLNIYWSALGVIDLVAVFLLLKYRLQGVLLTLAIMLSNVIVNSIAYYSLEVISDAWSLQLQTLFFGFCLGSAFLLWRTGVVKQT
ncbi:hypothetical protein WLQ65_18530 [Pseudoalteromonas piscicida]